MSSCAVSWYNQCVRAHLRVSAVMKQVQNCTHGSCSCEVKTYPEPHDMVHIVTPCSADGCSGYNTRAKLCQDEAGHCSKKSCSSDILIEKAARSIGRQYHDIQNF